MSFETVLDSFIHYGYWIVFAGILLDNAGLPLPGELFLLSLGALSRTGQVDPITGILVAWAAATIGDSIAYWLGRLGGQRLLHLYCRATLGSSDCLGKTLAFYHRRGNLAVVLGRFVVGIRGFFFPLAGSARMHYAKFLFFDGLGALLWAGSFILIGYSVGWRVQEVLRSYGSGSKILAASLGVGFMAYFLGKLYRRRRHGSGFDGQIAVVQVEKLLPSPPILADTCPCEPLEKGPDSP